MRTNIKIQQCQNTSCGFMCYYNSQISSCPFCKSNLGYYIILELEKGGIKNE